MPAIADLVHQTSTSTGTGNLTLSSVNGKQSFATAFGTGVTTNVFWYFISNQGASEWEYGTGHMSNSTTLVRDTVIASTNSNAAVNFSAGTKDVTNDLPASVQRALIGAVRVQAFTSSGTYTPDANLIYAVIECVAGGGAGGGVTGNTTGSFGGGGGGAGSYSMTVASAATVGASKTVTIGAAGAGSSGANGGSGGATSVGTLCTTNGGAGGGVADNSNVGSAASGGTAGTGTVATGGGGGTAGTYLGNATPSFFRSSSGVGGSSFFGGGGAALVGTSNSTAGNASSAYGAGGGGAVCYGGTAGAAGGNGGAGYVVITEFCSQ